MDARRLRRAVGDSRWRTLGRWRWAARAEADGKQAPVRSVLVGLHLFRRSRSGLPRLHARFGSGHAAEPLPARPARACCAPRAPEFVGSVALLRSTLCDQAAARCARGTLAPQLAEQCDAPTTSVQAERARTAGVSAACTESKRHRSLARQISTRQRDRAEQHDAAHKLRCARSAARLRAGRAEDSSAACPEIRRAS